MQRWLVVAAVMGLAAVDPGAVAAEEKSSQREGLYELFDQIWDWRLNAFPEFATHVGVPGHDDRWTDVSLEAIAQRQRDQRRFLAELEAIDSTGLDANAQLDHELIRKNLQRSIEGFQFHSEYLAINHFSVEDVHYIPAVVVNDGGDHIFCQRTPSADHAEASVGSRRPCCFRHADKLVRSTPFQMGYVAETSIQVRAYSAYNVRLVSDGNHSAIVRVYIRNAAEFLSIKACKNITVS